MGLVGISKGGRDGSRGGIGMKICMGFGWVGTLLLGLWVRDSGCFCKGSGIGLVTIDTPLVSLL